MGVALSLEMVPISWLAHGLLGGVIMDEGMTSKGMVQGDEDEETRSVYRASKYFLPVPRFS